MTDSPNFVEFYPEVAAAGGLGPALDAALRERGRPVEEALSLSGVAGVSPLLVETGRGSVMIYLAQLKRDFFLEANESGFTWVSGCTADMGILAEAVAKWRGGMPLDDFVRQFSFVEPGELAHALERGDIVAAKWEWILASEYHVQERSLLAELYAVESLRALMPAVSHHSVRLSFDWRGADGRYLMIEPPRGGCYRVRAHFDKRVVYAADSLESAVALVGELVAVEPGPGLDRSSNPEAGPGPR